MVVVNNYEGASIEIINNDIKNNRLILSPKIEHNLYSNYYNFIVKNDKNKEGIVYIKNLKNTYFKNDINQIVPLYKDKDGKYKPFNQNKIKIINSDFVFKVLPNETIEVSSFPKYTEENLNVFLNKIKHEENVKIIDDELKKIIIGNENKKSIVIVGRQHPGETLSSYFIEGIINSIIKDKKYNDYSYIIYPIVNINGVKNGNHRFTNDYDFNRMWNSVNQIKEIDFIKTDLKNYNVKLFIDVHCDEISKIDYIRTKNETDSSIGGIKVIKDSSKLRRFLRALIKEKKIIDLSKQTAREYISKNYNCESILVELSLCTNNEITSKDKGNKFINEVEGRSL